MTKGFEPAIPLPVITVSDAEQNALKELMPKLNTEGCEARAAVIKAKAEMMFDKVETTEVPPTFLERQNAEEVKRLESQIASLREQGERE